jgi:cyclic pyranopterin phosphate synthase
MPEENYRFFHSSLLMQANEIESIARIFVSAGVTKIRLTGGEPLLRNDFSQILHSLSSLPVELTLTTNASRIHEFLNDIENSGMKSVNVSLDTLDPQKFKSITRRDNFDIVNNNIKLLLSRGIQVKINVVVMKGINDNELIDFVEWTRTAPIDVRFIEFMPFNGNKWSSERVVTAKEMLEQISTRFNCEPVVAQKHDTSRKYKIAGHAGTVAFISTMSSDFCGDCNRIRLTADGKLKNCLFSKGETDLLTSFRAGNDISHLIQQTIAGKHKRLGGQFIDNPAEVVAESIENRSMISIGG